MVNFTTEVDSTECSNSMEINNTILNRNTTEIYLPSAIITGVLLSVIIFITIFGNLLVLFAVYINHHLRSTTNFFILNLACADLFLGICILPFSASLEILKFWPFGRLFCIVWASVDVLLCTASILTLCVISVDRYIGITRPLKHSCIMTKKRAYYVIIFVWILSFAISVGPLLGWNDMGSDPLECKVNDEFAYVLFSTACSFYIPMIIIVFVYIRIYREAIKHTSQILAGIKIKKGENKGITLRVHTGRNSQKSYMTQRQLSYESGTDLTHRKLHPKITIAGKIAKFKREKKAAKTLGIVVGVFVLCWLPFFFSLPLGALCEECKVPVPYSTIIFWLGYCNSMMNPIIYGFSSREFRRAFRRILRCQYNRKPRPLKKTLDSSLSNSEINHSVGNFPSRSLRHNGHSNYIPCRQMYTAVSDQEEISNKGATTPRDPNSLSPPRRNHLGKYTTNDWRNCSCDSESASLSENQMEALRLEQLEQNHDL